MESSLEPEPSLEPKSSRYSVDDLLVKLKTIENRLRNRGHRTTFWQDGISLENGKAEDNEGGVGLVAVAVHEFERRMAKETLSKVAKPAKYKSRVPRPPSPRAITPPFGRQEGNISHSSPVPAELPQFLAHQPQTRIAKLEQERKTPEAARAAAEDMTQKLRGQQPAVLATPRARLSNQDLADELLHLVAQNRALREQHDTLAERVKNLERGLEGHNMQLLEHDGSIGLLHKALVGVQGDRGPSWKK